MKNFIPIARFTYEYEYFVLKNLFDQENIQYYFKNETMASVVPFYSNALGGILLFIHKADKEVALKILNNFNNTSNLTIA